MKHPPALIWLCLLILPVDGLNNCTTQDISVHQNLTFPGGVLSPVANISWGSQEIPQIACIDKFVLLYRWEDENSLVLCPSYNVTQIDSQHYQCQANFSRQACNRTVTLTLESWIGNTLHQGPSGVVFINCSLSQPSSNDSAGLAEAIFSIIGSVAPILTAEDKTKCENFTEWTQWSTCSKSCGDKPGVRTRSRKSQCEEIKTDWEESICMVNKCPVHCLWSTWGEWSQCSQTCGTGSRTRQRLVEREPKYDGIPCLEQDDHETEACTAHSCPVNGEW